MSIKSNLEIYVPDFIRENKVFQALYAANGSELDKLDALSQDALAQCFIDTATWGLKYWEKFLEITSDETKAYDLRRSIIKAKLRSTGTVTTGMIQNVAESYENSTVDVIEHPENYSFDIKFITENGVTNLNSLQNAIEEIKPAHLEVKYKIISMSKVNLYYGLALLSGETVSVYPWQVGKISAKGNINVAISGARNVEKASIYPRKGEIQ